LEENFMLKELENVTEEGSFPAKHVSLTLIERRVLKCAHVYRGHLRKL
jgi:hypothetical protein